MPATPFRPPSPILQRPGSDLRVAIPSAAQGRPWASHGMHATALGDYGREPGVGCVQRPASPRIVARPASPLISARPSPPRVPARPTTPRAATRPAPLESDWLAAPSQSPPLQEPLQSPLQTLQQPFQSLQQPLQQPVPLQHSFELPLDSPTIVSPGVLVDNFPQNGILEPEGVAPEDDVASVRGMRAVGWVSVDGGGASPIANSDRGNASRTNRISRNSNSNSSISTSRNGDSNSSSGTNGTAATQSPRRSRSRVATSPTRPRPTSQPDCFRVLGLPRTATLQEIRIAYRSLCRKWHPDVNKDAGAAAMFVDVNRAYESALLVQERASKAKQQQQRPVRRKDDFDDFWDDFLGGGPSGSKADPRRRRQGTPQGTARGGDRARDPLAW